MEPTRFVMHAASLATSALLLLGVATSHAATKDSQAKKYARPALAAYLAGDGMEARRALEKAIAHCGGTGDDFCSPEVLAEFHRQLGAVYVVVLPDEEKALQHFRLALVYQPEGTLAPGFRTPEVLAAWEKVKSPRAEEPTPPPSEPDMPEEAAPPEKPPASVVAPEPPPAPKPATPSTSESSPAKETSAPTPAPGRPPRRPPESRQRGSLLLGVNRVTQLSIFKAAVKDGGTETGVDVGLLGTPTGRYSHVGGFYRISTIPRVELDYYVSDVLTVGGFALYASSSSDFEVQGQSSSDPSHSALAFGARAGWQGDVSGIMLWIRTGLGYSGQTIGEDDGDLSYSAIWLNADANVVVPLLGTVHLLLGGYFEGTLSGSVSAPESTEDVDVGELVFGPSLGLVLQLPR